MKRNWKKLAALASAAILTLGMATTAFADEESGGGTEESTTTTKIEQGTLIVNSQNDYDSKLTYAVYQLFTCDIDSDNVPSYTANGSNIGLLTITGTTTEGEGASTSTTTYSVEDIEAMSSDALYDLAALISTSDATAYTTLTTGSAETLPAGYYLLVPTGLATANSAQTEGGVVSAPIFVAVPEITKDGTTGIYTVDTSVEVEAKVTEVSTDKKITGVDSTYGTDDNQTSTGTTATAGEGDTITYTITNTVPKYYDDVDETEVNYYVVDTYDSNLTLAKDATTSAYEISVTSPSGLTQGTLTTKTVTTMNGTQYTVNRVENGQYAVSVDETNHTFTVYFNFDAVSSSTNVVITAKFTLDEDAVPGTAVNNKSELTYTNNYYTGSDSTLEDEVNVYTFALEVYKYDTETGTALSGAKFELQDEDGNKIAEATSNNGVVDFGVLLNAGTYKVVETKAPDGYRVDETERTVVITADKGTDNEYDGTATITVDNSEIGTTVSAAVTTDAEGNTLTTATTRTLYTVTNDSGAVAVYGMGNTAGTTLPGTGGIGTTLFTFGGLALVILAAIMFIVYSRKQRKQA